MPYLQRDVRRRRPHLCEATTTTAAAGTAAIGGRRYGRAASGRTQPRMRQAGEAARREGPTATGDGAMTARCGDSPVRGRRRRHRVAFESEKARSRSRGCAAEEGPAASCASWSFPGIPPAVGVLEARAPQRPRYDGGWEGTLPGEAESAKMCRKAERSLGPVTVRAGLRQAEPGCADAGQIASALPPRGGCLPVVESALLLPSHVLAALVGSGAAQSMVRSVAIWLC